MLIQNSDSVTANSRHCLRWTESSGWLTTAVELGWKTQWVCWYLQPSPGDWLSRVLRLYQHNILLLETAVMAIFPLTPDQTIAQMWSSGVWGASQVLEKSTVHLYCGLWTWHAKFAITVLD